jgi:phosphoribosylformylglycinamidine cyclo-ligase
MNLDDVICVGATEALLLSNSIARNAQRVDGDALAAVVRGYRQFVDGLRGLGIDVVLTGGETADVGDLVQTLVVDSTLFARLRREHVIDASRVRPGQLVVGLASAGRASYERAENSGIGANAERFPESYATTVPVDRVYHGRFRLDDALPDGGMSVGDALLSPTRTYAPVVKAVLGRARDRIGGIIHCTGGGQTKCLRFGRGLHIVKNDLLPVPALFRAIMDTGAVPLREMFQVFNMGHRMEVYCDPTAVEDVIAAARRFLIEAKVVGEVRAAPTGTNRLTIVAEGAELTYQA